MNSKRTLTIVLALLALLGLIGALAIAGRSSNKQDGLDAKIQVSMAVSQSSRDTDKSVQTQFVLGDPIQGIVQYSDITEETAVTYVVTAQSVGLETEVRRVELTLAPGTGSEFVSLPTSAGVGEYKTSVVHDGEVVTSVDFAIEAPDFEE